MELAKNEKKQKEMKINKNENQLNKNVDPIINKTNELIEHNCNNYKNQFKIPEIRNYLNNNRINTSENHLITDINKNNISFQDNNTFESLESSNKYDFVMNRNYNYNPKSSRKNSSHNNSNEYIHTNILSISNQENHNNKNNNNDIFQYYSEQKAFNPGLLFDISTKKSTRSSITKNEDECRDKNFVEICERNSLTKMINEYCVSNENDLDNNIQDNKMTINSFDFPKINNDKCNDNLENSNINLSRFKSINSEKMNLGNEEICNLLNEENQNKNDKENEESQISNNYINSKNNNINENKYSNNKNNLFALKNIKNLKEAKKDNNSFKQKCKENNNKLKKERNKENNIIKDEKENNNINKTKIIEKIPFQGNYIEYKEYEKYILEANHDELLNTGNKEDIFGKFVDNIIEKSYHIYINRQCPSCANLLTNGKSCIKCTKYHHLIKSGKIKKNKNSYN